MSYYVFKLNCAFYVIHRKADYKRAIIFTKYETKWRKEKLLLAFKLKENGFVIFTPAQIDQHQCSCYEHFFVLK